MSIFEWVRCPRCGRDCSLRLATVASAQRFEKRASVASLLLPVRAPSLAGSRWQCECGTQLSIGRRPFRVRDLLAGGVVATFWIVMGLFTPVFQRFPRIYWFAGGILVVAALAFSGVGKHQVNVVEGRSSET